MDIGDIKGGVWCHGASVKGIIIRNIVPTKGMCLRSIVPTKDKSSMAQWEHTH